MASLKYKMTTFQTRFKTEGQLIEKTFEEIYFGFKDKVKRTKETYNEYMNADKLVQLNIKDVGGFIGGETQGNKRTNNVRIKRSILTLDIDTKYPNIFQYLQRNVYFYSIVHSTHKHNPDENRFRLIAPLSREVNEDEYEALGRRIAFSIENSKTETLQGLFDETTFQPNRLMFYPSVSSDGEYICELLNVDPFSDQQKIIDVDKVLDEYLDKTDIYEWFKPTRVDEVQVGKSTLESKNPLKAKGMVGAFNRTYTITQAIEKFLGDTYFKERNGRYTYKGGDSHGGGLVFNSDTVFYSHHGTDPANLYYRSAFDLVRIHLFGTFDQNYTPEKEIEKNILEKTDSFKKMIDFCRNIPEVVEHSDGNIELKQRLEKQETFVDKHFSAEEKQEEKQEENDKSWLIQLDGMKSVPAKLDVVLSRDESIGNLFYYDTFRDNICFMRKPYWHKDFVFGSALADKDMAHIRSYLDKVYNIKGERVIDDSIVVEADKIQRNKVVDYLETLHWDGEERLETFFHDFFKVPLNPFTRVAFKHWLVGAVSRVYKAGSPLDLLLVIKGHQGIGKSLFFKKLATMDFKDPSEHLYSDTKIDFDRAKDSYEQLEGIWIYEWKELAGMNMSEQESIKAFIDKTEDKFRRSYGRRNVEIKRRVAFGGSTNDKTPLRDRTGNRRFLVMESPLKEHECYIKDPKLFSQTFKDQLIAEAIHLYKTGYDIFHWTVEELQWWEKSNDLNLVENDMTGVIESYLEMRRPSTWYSMTESEMLVYLDTYDFDLNKPKFSTGIHEVARLQTIDRVCISELWRIVLKQKGISINRFHRDLIENALNTLGWEITKNQRRFGLFGHQREIIKKVMGISNDNLPF